MLPQQTKDATYHLTLAVLVGLCGGIGAVILKHLIAFFEGFFFGCLLPLIPTVSQDPNPAVAVILGLGGLAAGLLVSKTAEEAKGHGIPEVIEASRVYGGKIRGRVASVKTLASALIIGSGGSAGREGPIAQIGASLGSLVGQRLRVGERQTRLLVACGMASGIGASFNAPLGGAIFAMEILLAEFESISATSIILASVVGTAFAVYLPVPGLESYALGTTPAFNAAGLGFKHPFELFFYLLMGLFFGVLSIVWIKSFYRIEGLFDRMRLPQSIKPAVGGIMAGLAGFYALEYGLLGGGYRGFDLALSGSIGFEMLLVLGFLKIIATSLSVGSGGSGGLFTPSLYIGCMFGGAFGIVFNGIAPEIAEVSMTYALVGAGALLAGAANAPLTCIIMIPEMAGDWLLLLPMMTACVSSYLVSTLFTQESIFTLKLLRRGVAIDIDHVLSEVHVGDIMTTKVNSVRFDAKTSELIEKMMSMGHTGYPVMKDGLLFGVVTFDDMQGAGVDQTVEEICTREVCALTPTDSAQQAVKMLYEKDVGRIIVVDEKDLKKVVGIVSRSDIIKAYQGMLNKKKRW